MWFVHQNLIFLPLSTHTHTRTRTHTHTQISTSVEDSCSLSLRRSIEGDPAKVQTLLKSCMELMDTVILGGGFKTSTVESRMKMEAGGIARQGLRLGVYVHVWVWVGVVVC